MSKFEEEYLPLLHRARTAEFGIAVATDEREIFRQRLYKIIRENDLPIALVCPAPPSNEVWLIRKEILHAAAEGPKPPQENDEL